MEADAPPVEAEAPPAEAEAPAVEAEEAPAASEEPGETAAPSPEKADEPGVDESEGDDSAEPSDGSGRDDGKEGEEGEEEAVTGKIVNISRDGCKVTLDLETTGKADFVLEVWDDGELEASFPWAMEKSGTHSVVWTITKPPAHRQRELVST